MQNWDHLFRQGELDETQSRFFQKKPEEELYLVSQDPHNVNNLASDPEYSDVLRRLRNQNLNWMKTVGDLGFIQETRIDSLRSDRSLYDAVREQDIPLQMIMESAGQPAGSLADSEILELLDHSDSSVRFWAATHLSRVEKLSEKQRIKLSKMTEDPSPGVRIAAAEALFVHGEVESGLSVLAEELDHPHFSVQLYALNVLESIEPNDLPEYLEDKIRVLNSESEDNSFGTDYYINRATETLFDDF